MSKHVKAVGVDTVVELLGQLHDLGPTTTIIHHLASVFEYKGVFPAGELGHGFFNFGTGQSGFQGHLGIDKITRIVAHRKQHRGREACAFVFENTESQVVFKVFLGRDANGEIYPNQRAFFDATEAHYDAT